MADGFHGSAARAWGVCSSSAARLAVHTSAGTLSSEQAATSESASSGTVSSQAGRCPGQRFSKNRSPVTPSGSRTIVVGRSWRWGSMAGAIRA